MSGQKAKTPCNVCCFSYKALYALNILFYYIKECLNRPYYFSHWKASSLVAFKALHTVALRLPISAFLNAPYC